MSRTPFFSQMEATECGAACLAMVLAHFGNHTSLVEVREACGVSRDGTSAAGLLRAARTFGLVGKGHRMEPEQLAKAHLPAILHWEFNHFVVATGVSKHAIKILDPAVGPRSVSMARANEAFTGVLLTFAPGADFRRKSAVPAGRGRYRHIFARVLRGIGLSALAALVLEVVGLVFPIASQVAIDFIVQPRQQRFLLALGAVLFVATILRFLIATARTRILGGLRMHLDTLLVTGFVEHMTRLPLSFFSQRSSGDLVSRTEAHAALRDVMRNLSTTFLDALLVLSYSALMLAYNLRLGAIVISLTAFRASFGFLAQTWIRNDVMTEIVADTKESSVLTESFAAPEAIRAFGIELNMRQRYVEAVADRLNATVSRERIEQNLLHMLPILNSVSLGLIYWVGGRLVSTDQMTIGVLAAFVAMASLVNEPLRAIVRAATGIPHVRQLLRRLDDIWEATPEREGGIDPGRLHGAIAVQALSVRHGGGALVLRELDLQLAPGERIAIVGPSGSGKSTLAQAISGLLAPVSGTVWLDRHPLHELDLSKVYPQVGIVSPDAGPLDASIRENIAIGNAECPLTDVVRAARDAAIHGEITALKDGYETRLSRSGAPLSGGQRQRLAIARALLKAPRILIFDEATSSLDVELEGEILDNLLKYDCTQIIITHRLSAMRHADRIIVMSGGQIADQGTLGELAERCPVFREMMQAHAGVKI